VGGWFRRHAVIGRCIVDFVTPAARLVPEVDGADHSGRHTADARRDAGQRRAAIRSLREAI
jgi:very-short-patch-repair endonuclease